MKNVNGEALKISRSEQLICFATFATLIIITTELLDHVTTINHLKSRLIFECYSPDIQILGQQLVWWATFINNIDLF